MVGASEPRTSRHVVAHVLLLTAVMALAGLWLLPQALAAEPPGQLDDVVVVIAEQHARGDVQWARYVATSADAAADLLAKRRSELEEGVPDGVYLVVMRGDFSLQEDAGRRGGASEGRASYLAFLYWNDGQYWNMSDLTLFGHAVPLESVGTPQALRPFALVHPTLDKALDYLRAILVVLGPAVLLALCAVLCAQRRRSAWPYVLAAGVAVAVAGWQIADGTNRHSTHRSRHHDPMRDSLPLLGQTSASERGAIPLFRIPEASLGTRP